METILAVKRETENGEEAPQPGTTTNRAEAAVSSAGFPTFRVADFPIGMGGRRAARGFGNPRYSRLGSRRYREDPGAPPNLAIGQSCGYIQPNRSPKKPCPGNREDAGVCEDISRSRPLARLRHARLRRLPTGYLGRPWPNQYSLAEHSSDCIRPLPLFYTASGRKGCRLSKSLWLGYDSNRRWPAIQPRGEVGWHSGSVG